MNPARGAAAFAAGAASVLGYAPIGAWPLTLAAFSVLLHLWGTAATPRAAALAGFLFGLGQFGFGVSWVYISLTRFGGMPAPIGVIATTGFCVVLALYPAAAGALQARLRVGPALRAMLLAPAAWVLLERGRGWLLTGFPWLNAGDAAIDTPLAGFAPVGGLSLVSLAVLVAAGALACLVAGHARRVAGAVLVGLIACGALLRLPAWTTPEGGPLAVALLQGNVPQEMKFDRQRYAETLETYARLAEGTRARLIVLPETALPGFLERIDPAYLGRLEAAAKRNQGDLLVGVPVRDSATRYTNSVLSLGSAPRQRYDKAHLVPFGEFIPPGFDWVLRLLSIPLSDFTAGATDQAPLALAGQRVAVNICYEHAYGAAIARTLPQASLLVNVSNVAWFGDSLAPAQHMAIARMRALETGRMLLTATNTGITAVINHDGEVVARLPQFVEGRLEAVVQGRRGATPYVRLGDALALAVCALFVLLAFAQARRAQSR